MYSLPHLLKIRSGATGRRVAVPVTVIHRVRSIAKSVTIGEGGGYKIVSEKVTSFRPFSSCEDRCITKSFLTNE